jgi:hypothetical protein
MIRRHLPLIAVLLAGAPMLRADDAKPAAEPPPPYELKNRSTFAEPNEVPRVPFWPIGWVKRQASAPAQPQMAEPVKTTLDEKSFKVTSILLNTGTALAVINGRAYSEGEYVRMPKSAGAAPLRVRVQRIADGVVTLQHADQILTVPIQRPELLEKKPEELLLDPNR